MDPTYPDPMNASGGYLAGFLDPLTAKEHRLVPIACNGTVVLGTDNSDEFPGPNPAVPVWLVDHVARPITITHIATADWETQFAVLYGTDGFKFLDVTSPVTDVLKRVILVGGNSPDDKDLSSVLAPLKEEEGFDIQIVPTVDGAMHLLLQPTTARRDLVLLSESTEDFFGAKCQFEDQARNAKDVQLQVIGTQSARKQPGLVTQFFRRAG